MSTRVGVLDRGRLVLQEDLADLRRDTGLVRVRTPDPASVVRLLDGRVEHRDGEELRVHHDDPGALNAELVAAGVRVTELAPVRHTLEEIVLAASTRA